MRAAKFFSLCSELWWERDTGSVAILSPLSTSTVATLTSLSIPIGSTKFQLKLSNCFLGIFTNYTLNGNSKSFYHWYCTLIRKYNLHIPRLIIAEQFLNFLVYGKLDVCFDVRFLFQLWKQTAITINNNFMQIIEHTAATWVKAALLCVRARNGKSGKLWKMWVCKDGKRMLRNWEDVFFW